MGRNRCSECIYYEPEVFAPAPDELSEWGECSSLAFSKGIELMADDEYGLLLCMRRNFGCVFFKGKT